jgi:hypothetical protein
MGNSCRKTSWDEASSEAWKGDDTLKILVRVSDHTWGMDS